MEKAISLVGMLLMISLMLLFSQTGNTAEYYIAANKLIPNHYMTDPYQITRTLFCEVNNGNKDSE